MVFLQIYPIGQPMGDAVGQMESYFIKEETKDGSSEDGLSLTKAT